MADIERVVVGSTNRGKLREIQAVLARLPVQLRSLPQPPEEIGLSFVENARLKAAWLARQTGAWVVADDSGLCVDALDGRPGVHSARYAGPDASDQQNVAKLLAELRDVPDAERGAAFACAVALAAPDEGVVLVVERRCRGRILREPRGSNGFGYDPVFFCPDFDATFAEVEAKRKNRVSHRGQALLALARSLKTLLEAGGKERPDMAKKTDYYVGIDLGGTYIKGGVVDSAGRVVSFRSIETEGHLGRDHVLDRMAMLVDLVREVAKLPRPAIRAVGIGSPGPLNTEEGIIYTAPNLPGWENLPLAHEIRERCGYPTFIENDANAASLAESYAGAGRGTQCMLMLTLGTGIGGGIVLDGRVWHGVNDCGAELGHLSICYEGDRCACGSIGCVETYASASAVARRARKAILAGEPSTLAALGDTLECADVFRAAAEGDALAQRIVAETAVFLGTAIGSLINTFNPDMVVLFGGMTNAGEQLFGPVREESRKRSFAMAFERCRIVPSQLGGEAGVIGAAVTALQRVEAAAKAAARPRAKAAKKAPRKPAARKPKKVAHKAPARPRVRAAKRK